MLANSPTSITGDPTEGEHCGCVKYCSVYIIIEPTRGILCDNEGGERGGEKKAAIVGVYLHRSVRL